MERLQVLVALCLALCCNSVLAQEGDLISTIPLESIPGSTALAADAISLEGVVDVSQNLTVSGTVEAGSTGYIFPDGSIQGTAAQNISAVTGISAYAGLYSNKIADFVVSSPFTELCIKGGAVLVDIHALGETTNGGNCVPGDLGWVIERNQRSAAEWAIAKMDCLADGMRLPEPFEFSYSCLDSATLGLNDMTGDREWVSNTPSIENTTTGVTGLVVPTMGYSTCSSGNRDWIARSDAAVGPGAYRCVR